MNIEEKLLMAEQLAKLKVDVIEAGFAVSSPGDFESVNQIAQKIKGSVIASLARTIKDDIKKAGEALKPAERRRIHTFIATSPIHVKRKLHMTYDQVIEQAVDAVKLAKNYTDDIEFSPEDATRSDWEYLCRILEAVIKNGATTVNIPDTVGYTTPQEYYELIRYLMNNVTNIDKAVVSLHCHNDLGMAVANSLSGILAGARQVECTINGIGERAGNASLEEIVMAIKTRKDFFKVYTDVNVKEIYRTSRLLTKLTGLTVQRNKAIVGENAFAHEAGIHQDGMIKERMTYEIMKPQDIGLSESRLVLGKHSGRRGLKKRLSELGFGLSSERISRVFEKFKVLADKKKEVYDEDIIALMDEEISPSPDIYKLESLQVISGTTTMPTATVVLSKEKEKMKDAASGNGPIEATYKAVERIVGLKGKLTSYRIKAITEGKDALGEVSIEVKFPDIKREISGRGIAVDVIEASARAYINALNKALIYRGKDE
jgi:2-isopropylmalate synthase